MIQKETTHSIITFSTPIITHIWGTPGIHTISIYAINGCGLSDTISWELEIAPLLEPIEITTVGNTLVANSQPNYQWYFEGALIEGATNQTLEITEDGYYTVESSNDCGNEAASILGVVTSNNEIIKNLDITILPNPVTSTIDILSSNSIDIVLIYNVKGERVYQKRNINKTHHQVSVDEYPSGIYHVQIFDLDGNQKIDKVIKH